MIEGEGSDDAGSEASRGAAAADMDAVKAELARTRRQLEKLEREAREDRQRISQMHLELEHRARNTLSLVRSVFRRTAETGASLEEVALHFSGRLDVLARYQLPRRLGSSVGTDLESIIRDEFHDFRFGHIAGVTIEGPDVLIPYDWAQPFALAIHELVTNALKFGALAVNGATLNVAWKISDDFLKLSWTETGVPMVAGAPWVRGFGRQFIEEALPYQIGADTEFDLRPGGAYCRISLPMAAPAAADQGASKRQAN